MSHPFKDKLRECNYCGEQFEAFKDEYGDLFKTFCKPCHLESLQRTYQSCSEHTERFVYGCLKCNPESTQKQKSELMDIDAVDIFRQGFHHAISIAKKMLATGLTIEDVEACCPKPTKEEAKHE